VNNSNSVILKVSFSQFLQYLILSPIKNKSSNNETLAAANILNEACIVLFYCTLLDKKTVRNNE
jgi:hypothetical protein